MCGIVGFVGPGTAEDLHRMTDALTHRGPDGKGIHIDPHRRLFLGHRRLAILDLEGGDQPMWSQDRKLCIIFNGEIYNHADLRATLEQRGHRFQSHHSDTETLLYGYREWGRSLPERLNGMFAFVIYDLEQARLFAARDRFGKKPFFYKWSHNQFLFASELSALQHHTDFSAQIDPLAVQKLFAYGFIPAPHAIHQGCRKLPSGSWLELELDGMRLQQGRYWQFRLHPDSAWNQRPEEELAEELRTLLSQAVQRRMESDVPLGFFLSGGIDSSTVLAMATRHRPAHELQTFAIGFHEPSYDESAYARQEAQRLGTQHREEILSLEQAKSIIPQVLGHLDEPLGDPSILPTTLLSAFARRHVTVALGGDGGDELFAGYDPFLAMTPARIYQALVPTRMHRALRSLANRLPRSGRNMSLDFKLRRFLSGLSHPPSLWNPTWMAPLEPDAIADLLHQPVDPEELYAEALGLWNSSDLADPTDRSLEYFTNFYLTDDILVKVDRASMMMSLEVRAPFLDNDVVAFAQKLPIKFKLRHGVRKYLLKKAMTGLLPKELIHRRKKGFGVPIADWLQTFPETPPLSPLANANPAWVAEQWRQHRTRVADHRLFLWSWLSLSLFNHQTDSSNI
ncbi:MAG: asparagine synthase (glutamine-hydrolyzing) [Magnetococcales bacterium]|nr:asparagine synthase (glutamine-hydrolyzing) [Magnetococcales bacterium]NGZ05011.1 asparagine synthase (glutamine-hydrolyzing) [Magnetococcales bacterium]